MNLIQKTTETFGFFLRNGKIVILYYSSPRIPLDIYNYIHLLWPNKSVGEKPNMIFIYTTHIINK